jgi:error-prone DNA polymerase
MRPSYAALHCLSNFSFLCAASHAEELVEASRRQQYSAIAITDECSVAGVVRAHVAAKACGIKLLIGAHFTIDDAPEIARLILIATSREGYGNLCELITHARRRAEKGQYQLLFNDMVHGVPECLAIVLPDLTAAPEKALATIITLRAFFPDRCWLGAALQYGADDIEARDQLQHLATAARLPLVAAECVVMHDRDRKMLHDIVTATRLHLPVSELGMAALAHSEAHIKPISHIVRRYPIQWVAETLNVAARCTFSLDELRYQYPREVVPEGETPESYLRKLTYEGMTRRFGETHPAEVTKLIEHELRVIGDLQYEAFFLTIYDVVKFAREKNILCQGRGSAANSAVCYCLGITEVDPSRMQVLFERFISRERNEPPDIDVDFEHERREEVIQYLYNKYGRERTALTAAVSTYRPKGAIRDVGKALGLSLDQIDSLSKAIVWWDGRKIADERLREAGFDPAEPLMQRLLELTHQLIGFPRHLSQHSGGFVIARDSLMRLVPIENAAMPDRTVIQWDKDDLDELGLIKVDVLALGMLTAIRKTFDALNRFQGTALGVHDIPPEDAETYRMIQRADTIGVFQIESRAQMSMLPRLKPKCFYDLVIEVAIVRPGPIQGGMVHPYLKRRNGIEKVSYPSADVKSVLERTLGVSIFQEQVMQLAVIAAGFTPGEADRLRRAMAAWKRKGGIEPFRDQLLNGMRTRGYSAEYAEQIYKQMQGFGEYGFPESHAASFALLVYVSCWLKCHHPAAFLCGMLNSQPLGFYSPSQLVQDAKRHEVMVRPVDVMVSADMCVLEIENSPIHGALEVKTPQTPCELRGSTSGNFSKPTARANLVPAVLALHGVKVRSSKRAWSAREGFEKLPSDKSFAATKNCLPGEGRGPSFDAHRHATNLDPGLRREDTRLLPASALSNQGAVRLGLCMVAGISKDVAARIVAARAQQPFADIADLKRRAALDQKELNALAAADALQSLAGHRREAYWQAIGTDRDAALFIAPNDHALPQLFPPTEASDIVEDYRTTSLTLRRHPVALLRPRLTRAYVKSATEINTKTVAGRRVRAAGIVTCRQHPATAKGTTFVTLEDETGYVNVVVWESIATAHRKALVFSRFMTVIGRVEKQGAVVHLIAEELIDHTRLLGALATASRDFH